MNKLLQFFTQYASYLEEYQSKKHNKKVIVYFKFNQEDNIVHFLSVDLSAQVIDENSFGLKIIKVNPEYPEYIREYYSLYNSMLREDRINKILN
jgi:DNA-directed RNA polymerase subunit F